MGNHNGKSVRLRFQLFLGLMLVLMFSQIGYTQDTAMTLNRADLFTTDRAENLYIVTDGNYLTRYDLKLKESGHYNNNLNGDIQWIDATNPLKVILFYRDFGKITILDNMLSEKTTLDLMGLGYMEVTACALAEDGNIWIYDANQARLIKLNSQNQILSESNDLRTETQTVPRPNGMVADKGMVFLSDPEQGVYMFDRYGNLSGMLSQDSAKNLQLIGDQIIWQTGNQLKSYRPQSTGFGPDNQIKQLTLPTNIISARLGRRNIYLLYPDKLVLSPLSKEK